MKWAKTKKELDDDGVLDMTERKTIFKEYKTMKELEHDLNNPKKFEKWVTFPDDDPKLKSFSLRKKARRRYEVFCGGYLYYHDVEFKKYCKGKGHTDETEDAKWKVYPDKFIGTDGNEYPGKDFEHNIYFEWFPKEKGNKPKTRVIIHINPTPVGFNANPPRPPGPPPPESND